MPRARAGCLQETAGRRYPQLAPPSCQAGSRL